MTDASDHEIVAGVLGGDAEAFRLIVERHGRKLYRIAYRIVGGADDAEDVVQETFIRAFRQLGSYDRRAAFSTWLYRIAANCAVDLLRTRRRRSEEQATEETLMPHNHTTPVQERVTHGGEIRTAVARAMESLSANERAAFVLRHFEGMSIAEISRALGTKADATKHTIFRAERKLRLELEPLVR